MTLWDTKKLSEDLKSGLVTENEKMKYFLFQSILVTLFTSSFFYPETAPSKFEYIVDALMIIITFVGIIYTFKQNVKGDNKAFLERVTCLGVPILMRLIAVLILVALPIVIIFGSIINTSSGSNGVAVSTLLLEIAFYWRLSHWVSKTSHS